MIIQAVIEINNMTSQVICECPICYDVIGDTNNITTECGHKFHASCLMTNVSCNGFSCPCCRTAMATISSATDSEDEDEEDDEEDDDDEDDYDDEDGSETDTEAIFDDSVEYLNERKAESILRGFRFFMNQINNVENNEGDEADEENEIQVARLPTVDFITEKLFESGLSLHSIIGAMLSVHANYKIDTKMVQHYSTVWETLHTLIDSNTDHSK